jgi:hypothetical protein
MSTKPAITFSERIVTDEKFLSGAKAAVEGRNGESAVDALMRYAAVQGQTVTPAELKAVRNVMLSSDELEEEALAGVAGGVAAAHPASGVVDAPPTDPLGSSVGDDAQAKVDLNALVKAMQQTASVVQSISNIQNTQHDVSMATIRNTRG